jgi:hypothetical protein
MLFRIFKHKEIEDFAKTLADRFAKKCPPELQDETRDGAVQKREAAMTSIHSLVGDFHKRVPLGLYKRAELANSLKWEMKERGYVKTFINAVVYDMLVHLASTRKS